MSNVERNFAATLLGASLSWGAFFAACGDDGDESENIEIELCEHMQEGPVQSVTATTSASAGTLPNAAFAHTRVDISLPTGAAGYVAFEVSEAGEVIFALDRAIGFRLLRTPGEVLEAESSTTGAQACSEVAKQYVYDLEVRSYILELTEDDPTKGLVGLVAESLGPHAEGEHEH